MAGTDAAASALRRRPGLRDARIEVTGALREVSKPLPCNEDDREELAGLLRGRLVWLAARLRPEEIDAVLTANARVMRLSHRVLLVIVPDDPDEAAAFPPRSGRAGLRYVTWSEGASCRTRRRR